MKAKFNFSRPVYDSGPISPSNRHYRCISTSIISPTISDFNNTSLKKLVRKLARDGPLKVLPTPRRIRLLFNGAFVADTTSALYVWEHEFYPQLYLPMECFVKPKGFDVNLTHGEAITAENGQIVGGTLELAVRREGLDEEFRTITEMVLFAADLEGKAKELRDYVKVVFNTVDQWFEEDTPIYVHPKDPFKRVETLSSSRPIRITLDDHILAESNFSVHLHETLLPPRYYLPLTSLNTIYLRPSTTTSECPYKGVANYHHVVIDAQNQYNDLVWWYRHPTPECVAVTGMRCFYTEKVDVWIKDHAEAEWKKLERPKTHMA